MGVCILHINSLCFSVIHCVDIYSISFLHMYGDCISQVLLSSAPQEFIWVHTILARQKCVCVSLCLCACKYKLIQRVKGPVTSTVIHTSGHLWLSVHSHILSINTTSSETFISFY